MVGPGTFNIDFSVHKTFSIGERVKTQFRVELFNAFNHTLLNNPDTTLSDDNFGRITDARDPRIVQLGLKFLF